jgi:transposase InsO family protein
VWKFGIISPAVNHSHSYSSDTGFFMHLSTVSFTHPVTKEISTFSRETFRRWTEAYRRYGLEGLMPGTRKDSGTFRSLPQKVQEEIKELIQKHPRIPNTEILYRLKSSGTFSSRSCSQSSVDRFVRSLSIGRDLPQIHNGKERKAFEMEHFNDMWQADTTYLGKLKGRKVWMIIIIDDASRMPVGYGLFYEDNSINFQKVLKEAIQTYGLPKALYTDNGAPYANRHLDIVAAQLGISLIHAPVRDGAAKGKIERFNRTLKSSWLSAEDLNQFQSLEEIRESVSSWINTRYVNKEHSSLRDEEGNLITPRIRMQQELSLIKRLSQEDLDARFLNRVERRVRTDSTITLEKRSYDVPAEWMKEIVQVYFDPSCLDTVWVEAPSGSERIKAAVTDRHSNARIKRKQHMKY